MLILHQVSSDSGPEYLKGFISGEIIKSRMVKKLKARIVIQWQIDSEIDTVTNSALLVWIS